MDGSVSSKTSSPRAAATPAFVRQRSLDDEVRFVKGVGEAVAQVLAKLNIYTVFDLLMHLPRRYEDRTHFRTLSQVVPGEAVTVHGSIVAVDNVSPRPKMTITKVIIDDGTGTLELVWFNQPYLKDRFLEMRGQDIVAYGVVQQAPYHYQMQTPEWEPLTDSDPLAAHRIVPVYPLTEGLPQSRLRRIMYNALQTYEPVLVDCLPPNLRRRLNLMPFAEAVRNAHFPESLEHLERARRRLIFEEFYLLQLHIAQRKMAETTGAPGIRFRIDKEVLWRKLHEIVPFDLTGAQRRVIEEIWSDMAREYPMNRLLQGDVGSGKTIVAAAAILACVENGYQAAVMVPTEILAEQHFIVLSRLFRKLGIIVDLAVGSLTQRGKKSVRERIATGITQVAVGTHALIQEGLEFRKLGLVIIDEQHRFGVLQRAALREKGENPDVLVMTATPIPRTLTMTLYGDLDLSIIDELPPGRRPVKTHRKRAHQRAQVYEAVRQLIQQGQQAYVVCPLITESEKLQVKAAEELAKHLQEEVFPKLRVGLLHGQMKPMEKEEIMERFRAGEIDILVSTTVIEVGVDVPNASVMVIEDAERFGLAQLHQLRGRVGRGAHQSYCILISDSNGEDANRRLDVLVRTNDGFVIAEEDLRLRGPGEIYGTRQSGVPSLRVADILRDAELLELARQEAFNTVRADPELQQPQHRLLQSAMQRNMPRAVLATVS
jgi:ATP-dependent DNA helicase RecG